MNDMYATGMDDALDAMMPTQLPLETVSDMFVSMGLSAMTIDNLIGIFTSPAAEGKHEDTEEEHEHSAYLSGNLNFLEAEMDASDYPDSEMDFLFKARKPRNINFAKSTLKYLAEGAKDEIFFVSMGINHLLGEYGYLNLMSALLGKPLLRFDDKTGTFVPGETYLDAFAAGRPALLEALRAQGVMPVA